MTRWPNKGEAWQGDWRGRLAAQVKECGHSSLLEFASAFKEQTYPELTGRLPGPFAPIQVITLLGQEHLEQGTAVAFAADSLARILRERVRAALRDRSTREFQAAAAFGAWESAIGARNKTAIDAVWAELKEEILSGWLPRGIDDQRMLTCLQRHQWTLTPIER